MTSRRRSEPARTCIGCRRRLPQGALERLARAAPGGVVVSRTAPGRGAWLCKDAPQCLASARTNRSLDRFLGRRLLDEEVLRLESALAPTATINKVCEDR